MNHAFWQRQNPDSPLFPDLQWSRPETKRARGKLLIVGGHSQGFTAPAQAYSEANAANIGSARVLLPQHVQKLLPKSFSEMEFAPSTPSGSFARQALAELLGGAHWADGVLLAGDLGRNSETAILLEEFIKKYQGQLTLAQDSLDYFLDQPERLLNRSNTLLAPTFNQLQRIAIGAKSPKAFTSNMNFLDLVGALHLFSKTYSIALAVQHLETIFITVDGKVSSTKVSARDEIALATHAAVWWLQHKSKPYESITTSLLTRQLSDA